MFIPTTQPRPPPLLHLTSSFVAVIITMTTGAVLFQQMYIWLETNSLMRTGGNHYWRGLKFYNIVCFLLRADLLLSTQNWVQGLQRCEASEDDPGQVPVPAPGWENQPRDQLQRHLQGASPSAVGWQQGPGEEEDTQFVQRALHRPH